MNQLWAHNALIDTRPMLMINNDNANANVSVCLCVFLSLCVCRITSLKIASRCDTMSKIWTKDLILHRSKISTKPVIFRWALISCELNCMMCAGIRENMRCNPMEIDSKWILSHDLNRMNSGACVGIPFRIMVIFIGNNQILLNSDIVHIHTFHIHSVVKSLNDWSVKSTDECDSNKSNLNWIQTEIFTM